MKNKSNWFYSHEISFLISCTLHFSLAGRFLALESGHLKLVILWNKMAIEIISQYSKDEIQKPKIKKSSSKKLWKFPAKIQDQCLKYLINSFFVFRYLTKNEKSAVLFIYFLLRKKQLSLPSWLSQFVGWKKKSK